uniref:Uncharacterized protein n=1 Tax=Ciona intestinalis TaxID=7719 RepID=F6RAV7_CIOIN
SQQRSISPTVSQFETGFSFVKKLKHWSERWRTTLGGEDQTKAQRNKTFFTQASLYSLSVICLPLSEYPEQIIISIFCHLSLSTFCCNLQMLPFLILCFSKNVFSLTISSLSL